MNLYATLSQYLNIVKPIKYGRGDLEMRWVEDPLFTDSEITAMMVVDEE